MCIALEDREAHMPTLMNSKVGHRSDHHKIMQSCDLVSVKIM